MIYLFPALLVLIAAAGFGLQFYSRLRTLRVVRLRPPARDLAGRYRPMLRLLSDADLEFARPGRTARKTIRAERRRIFRGYLACLTRDYASMLAGLRIAMVQSGVDRPDLARALSKNQFLFALAICRIEYRLALHAAGIGKVDVSGLVQAFDTMRNLTGASFAQPTASLA